MSLFSRLAKWGAVRPGARNITAKTSSDGRIAIPALARVPVMNLRVATFGPSTADFGTVRATAATDQTVCDVPIGTTTTTVSRLRHKIALQMFYPAANLVANGGISGQNTTQTIAREGLAASSTRKSIQDVIDLTPDVILYRCSGINNLIGMTAANTQADIDAIYNDHIYILDALLSSGAYVIDAGIYGYDATNGVPPSAQNLAWIRSAIVQLNSRYAAAVASRVNCDFINPVGMTCNTDGSFLPACTPAADGTHLTPFAQYREGIAEAKLLTARFGASAKNRFFIGPNLLGSLAQFVTGATSGVGFTASGFSWVASNCVRSGGKVETINGKRYHTMIATPTAQNGYININCPAGFNSGNSIPIPIVAGGTYGFEADVIVKSLDGSPLDSTVDVFPRLDFRNSGGGRLVVDVSSTQVQSGYSLDSSTLEVHGAFPPVTLSDGSGTLTSASMWYYQILLGATQPVKVGVANPRIVRLS